MSDDGAADEVRLSRALWIALSASLLAATMLSPWHSSWTVDDRTYLEMSRGVSLHGLPWLDNGPADALPELQARWNRWHAGHMWGTYTPVYPYLAAAALSLGGVRAGIALNFVVLLLAAVFVGDLSRRATGRSIAGAIAAWALVVATPAIAMTPVFSPYTLVVLESAAMLWLGARVIEGDARALRWSVALGALAAATAQTNLVGLAVSAAAVGASILLPAGEEANGDGASRRRVAAMRAGAAAVGALPVLAVALALNRHRFGETILFHARCVWLSTTETCADGRSAGYSVDAVARGAAAVVLWLGCAMFAALRLRARARVAALGSLALLALLAGPLRAGLLDFASRLIAFWVDPAHLLGPPSFPTMPDGLGNHSGPAVVKSLLQCAPALALAFFARPQGASQRRVALLCAAVATAHWVMLSTRFNTPGPHALGWPFAQIRYNLPGVPALVVLAAMAATSLPLRRGHAVLGAGVALALGFALAAEESDLAVGRRLLLLRGTLIAALLVAGLMALSRQTRAARYRELAAWAVAAALGLSVAVNLGGDLALFARMRGAADARLDAIASVTPPRFALLGSGSAIDPVLALRASRDVEYLDLAEVRRADRFMAVLSHWARARRPVFGVLSEATAASMRSLVDVTPVVNVPGLYRVSWRSP